MEPRVPEFARFAEPSRGQSVRHPDARAGRVARARPRSQQPYVRVARTEELEELASGLAALLHRPRRGRARSPRSSGAGTRRPARRRPRGQHRGLRGLRVEGQHPRRWPSAARCRLRARPPDPTRGRSRCLRHLPTIPYVPSRTTNRVAEVRAPWGGRPARPFGRRIRRVAWCGPAHVVASVGRLHRHRGPCHRIDTSPSSARHVVPRVWPQALDRQTGRGAWRLPRCVHA